MIDRLIELAFERVGKSRQTQYSFDSKLLEETNSGAKH